MSGAARVSPKPCDPTCPGWAIFNEPDAPEIQRCDDCWRGVEGAPDDDDYAAQPECRAALERALQSRCDRFNERSRRMAEVSDAAKLKVTIEVEVEWKHVENELCSAWEGGSNYWLRCHDFRSPTDPGDAAKVEHRFQNALYAGGACLCCVIDDDGRADGEVLELTREKLIAGLQLFAQRYPKHFADMQTERGDANTGDLFLQLCLLGEIVYG